ncbi:hypothetical protein ACFLU5_09000 [Bacteroidota bacterium]
MFEIPDLKLRCESAALRTEEWMIKHLSEEKILSHNIPDPVSYYKWPLTLYIRGRIHEARELLKWIMEKSLSENGDLICERSGFHKDFHSYANLWLVLATIKLDEVELTDNLLGFLLKHHNQTTGGMITIPTLSNEKTEDPLSTSFLGMAACALKDQNIADLVLKYLHLIFDLQPEHDRFWLRTTPEGDLISRTVLNEDPKTYVINIGKHDESYYFLGAMCFFLASYIEHFGRNILSDNLVNRLKPILERAGPEALHTIWAAKVAPGCVALYSVLSDEKFLKLAIPVIDAVLQGQSDEGCWLKGDKPWVTVSAEQCYWLTFIRSKL